MKIAVASCSKIQSFSPQPVWSEIQAEKPDALLLLGDTVYLDHDHHNNAAALRKELHEKYQAQFSDPAFAALIANLKARDARVFAIYDDHDFLGNNRYGGDHDPALRDAARAEFVSTFAPPMTGPEVYSVTRLGPVDLVVLDERFHRTSPLAAGGERDAILGVAQWEWFENVVRKSDATYVLVASSTTLHTFGDESWEQYPGAFQRMVALLRGRVGALVVSGDVHRNAAYDDSGVIELVTSAVARNGIVFGSPRKNYGMLTFHDDRLHVELRSLKVSWRFDFSISLGDWELP